MPKANAMCRMYGSNNKVVIFNRKSKNEIATIYREFMTESYLLGLIE